MKLLAKDTVRSKDGGKWYASVFDKNGNYLGDINFRWGPDSEKDIAEDGWFKVQGKELLDQALAEAKEYYGKKAFKISITLPDESTGLD